MPRRLRVNRSLLLVIAALLIVGLVTVASAGALLKSDRRNIFFIKQGIVALIGLSVLLTALKIPTTFYMKKKILLPLQCAALALLTLILFLPAYKDVHRWLVFHGFTIQPSEFAKIILIFTLAAALPGLTFTLKKLSFLIFPLLASILILREPDVGTSVIFLFVTGVLLYVAGLPKTYLAIASILALMVLTHALFSRAYPLERLNAFINPSVHAGDDAYQAIQASLAIGSGRILGKGLGASTQKLFYLPQPHTDFAFAIVGEEWGFVGSATLLFLYFLFLLYGARVAVTHPDERGRYLAFGITLLIFIQAIVHMSVNLSLLPTKGLALPFVSYGGSSLIVTSFLAGVLLKLSEER